MLHFVQHDKKKYHTFASLRAGYFILRKESLGQHDNASCHPETQPKDLVRGLYYCFVPGILRVTQMLRSTQHDTGHYPDASLKFNHFNALRAFAYCCLRFWNSSSLNGLNVLALSKFQQNFSIAAR